MCSSFPCMNGGKCEPAGLSYICHCKTERFRGLRCEIDKDPCLRQPCLNGGVYSLVSYFFWNFGVNIFMGQTLLESEFIDGFISYTDLHCYLSTFTFTCCNNLDVEMRKLKVKVD